MEFLSPQIAQANRIDLFANVEVALYSLLCVDDQGSLVRYVHEATYPPQGGQVIRTDQIRRKVARVNTPFTLVPRSEFQESMLPQIIREAFPFDEPEHVFHIPHGPFTCIFIVKDELKEVLDTYFTDFEVEHSIIELYKQQHASQPSILAHWTKEGMIVLAMKDGLQLANYYPIQSGEDAIYYVVSAYQSIDANPLTLPLSMSGRIAEDSQYFQKLSGFVRDFEWKGQDEKLPSDFHFQPHLFYHLYQ